MEYLKKTIGKNFNKLIKIDIKDKQAIREEDLKWDIVRSASFETTIIGETTLGILFRDVVDKNLVRSEPLYLDFTKEEFKWFKKLINKIAGDFFNSISLLLAKINLH